MKETSRLSSLDTRILLFYLFLIILGLTLYSNLVQLLYTFSIAALVATLDLSLFKYLSQLWSYKWLFVLVIVFNSLILWEFDLIIILQLLLMLLTIITAFNVLNNSINPDEVVELLLKLKVPPNLAWSIGLTLRQVFILIEEIKDVRSYYVNRYNWERNRLSRIKHLSLNIAMLMSATLSKSIIRSKNLADVLKLRGFTTAHEEIIYNRSSLKKLDYISIIILTVLIIPFLLLSSQVFMLQI